MQSPHRVGLLVGRVGREPLAAVRVNPVGKALDDLYGSVRFHALHGARSQDRKHGRISYFVMLNCPEGVCDILKTASDGLSAFVLLNPEKSPDALESEQD